MICFICGSQMRSLTLVKGPRLEVRFLFATPRKRIMDVFTKYSLLYQLRKELSYLEWKKLGLKNLEPLKEEVDKQIEEIVKVK